MNLTSFSNHSYSKDFIWNLYVVTGYGYTNKIINRKTAFSIWMRKKNAQIQSE